MAQFLLKDILEDSDDELGLKQIAAGAGLTGITSSIRVQRYESAYGLGRIRRDVILIVSPLHISELFTISTESGKHIFQSIISERVLCIGISETERLPETLLYLSEAYGIPVFASVYDEFLLESRLCRLLRERIEYSISMHGTLVNVSGLGVMLTGESGTGKTECSLELVGRGHRWIADDAVEVERRGDSLYGRSDELVKCLINRRSRGIVQAEDLLGVQAILDDSTINLIVELKKTDHNSKRNIHREEKSCDILGVKLLCMVLPGFPETRKIHRHVELRVQELISNMERGCS